MDTAAVVELDVTCPCCRSRIEVPAEADRDGEPPLLTGVECPVCEWEFAVDRDGEVVDDGELEDETPALDADGEWRDDWAAVECPRCSRHSEVGEEGVFACPRCRWVGLVDRDGWFQNVHRVHSLCPACGGEGWQPAGGYDEPCPDCGEHDFVADGDEVSHPGVTNGVCPYCGECAVGTPGDCVEFERATAGWVFCDGCGWEFFVPRLVGEESDEGEGDPDEPVFVLVRVEAK